MESMVADSPGDGAFLAGSRSLVGLTLDTVVHDVISADGTVVDDNIPSPQSNGIPLLDFKALLSICVSFPKACLRLAGSDFSSGRASRASIRHIYVRHRSCIETVCAAKSGEGQSGRATRSFLVKTQEGISKA